MRILLHARAPRLECRPRSASRPRGRCASSFEISSCCRITSVSCMPIVNTGFSEVIGSWKIMLISLAADLADLVPATAQQVASLETDLAGDDLARADRGSAAGCSAR